MLSFFFGSTSSESRPDSRIKCVTDQGKVAYPFAEAPLIDSEMYCSQNVITEEIVRYGPSDDGGEKFYLLLKGVFSPEECSRLIEESEKLEYESLEGLYDKSYRDNARVMVDDESLVQNWFTRMKPFIDHYYNTWVARRQERGEIVHGQEMRGLNERLRFCRYGPGGIFKAHRDASALLPQRRLESHLTVMAYLNDVDPSEGGSTRFYSTPEGKSKKDYFVAAEVQPTVGSIVIFPHHYLHDGDRFIGTCKYILRSDVMFET